MTPDEIKRAARRIVSAIEADFTDRKGLKQDWQNIGREIQADIRKTWRELAEAELKTANGPKL